MAKKILLADDSITIQKVVELTFAEGNYEVVCASDGAQAIRKIEESAPDIALVDVMMPQRNGYDVCAHIKKDPDLAWIPVLLLTGTFEPFDPRRSEQVGANGHIVKPFESRSLVSLVEQLIAEHPRPGSEPGPESIVPSQATGEAEVVNSGEIFTAGNARGEAGARISDQESSPATVRMDAKSFFSQLSQGGGADVLEAPASSEVPSLGPLDLAAASSDQDEPTVSMRAASKQPGAGAPAPALSASDVERMARERIEELVAPAVKEAVEKVIREIAWEVIPEVAEALVTRRIRELEEGAADEPDASLH